MDRLWIALLVAIVAYGAVSTAPAATQVRKTAYRFEVDRDTGNNGNEDINNTPPTWTEGYNNAGAKEAVRGAKGAGYETYLCDFNVGIDVDPVTGDPVVPEVGTIKRWMADNPLNAACNEWYSFRFQFTPVAEWPNDDAGGGCFAFVWTLNLAEDWAEGNGGAGVEPGGGADLNFDWSEGTAAATNYYARTYWRLNDNGTPGDDTDDFKELDVDHPDLTAWLDENGSTIRPWEPNPNEHCYHKGGNTDIHLIYNSTDFWCNYMSYGQVRGVDLDYTPGDPTTLMEDVLNNPLNRGIALGGYTYDNTVIYTRERTNVDQRPHLMIYVDGYYLEGDADCNGTVELADLSSLAFNWDTLTGATWQMGDFDLDGDVDLTDLSALAFNWGDSCANPPVPEPCSLALLGLGACLPLLRRRRK